MLCPICNVELSQEHPGVLECPTGHGALVTGKHLSGIKRSSQKTSTPGRQTENTAHAISCPHCSSSMHKVNYNSTGIIIDTCTMCHYRWLDAGEVHKITTFKPDMQAKDLLFIADIDRQIQNISQRKHTDPNPRLPLQGSYRAGSEILGGYNHDARLGSIVGQGLYGIIKGLTHSKTSRYLTIATLLIFGLLFLVVVADATRLFGN